MIRRLLWLAAVWAIVAIAWILGACGGTYAWHAPTRAELPTNATAQVVARSEVYQTQRDVPMGWWRSDDSPVGPYYFLFSTQGYACLVSAADFVMARTGEEWLCAAWRRSR